MLFHINTIETLISVRIFCRNLQGWKQKFATTIDHGTEISQLSVNSEIFFVFHEIPEALFCGENKHELHYK